MPRLCINGRFLTRSVTGVDRYAREIVRKLDALLQPGRVVIAVPERAEIIDPPICNSIDLIRCGSRLGHLWEQFDLARYLKESGALGVNLCNTAPVSNPGIVCIHDVAVDANPDNYSLGFRLWYRFLNKCITRRAEQVLTVSEFSKEEIKRYYPASCGRISVIPNAWQHMERIESDESIFAKSGLEPGSYYFAMSSLSPNKNLKWLVETAKLNPNETIAIAGGVNAKVFGEYAIPEADNAVYLGYVSDGEAKALMEGCKGFLFPTFYEGFGLPPMEALFCGAPIAISNTEVMHEVYGGAARYIDPHEPCDDLGRLFAGSADGPEFVLNRFSWEKSAEKLYCMLEKRVAGILVA